MADIPTAQTSQLPDVSTEAPKGKKGKKAAEVVQLTSYQLQRKICIDNINAISKMIPVLRKQLMSLTNDAVNGDDENVFRYIDSIRELLKQEEAELRINFDLLHKIN